MGYQGLSEECLRANLTALASRFPSLAERLLEPVAGDHIQIEETASGDVTARLKGFGGIYLHSPLNPLSEAESAAQGISWMKDRSILCVGIGLGHYVAAILKSSVPSLPVIAYERDPWLLRLTLMRFNFVRDILAGRLIFILGTDVAMYASGRESPPFPWPHPVLGRIYQEEMRCLEDTASASDSSRRAMVVSGGLFVSDVIDALRDHQFLPLTWNPMAVSRDESVHQIQRFNPQFIFAINYCNGLPELCKSLGIPLIIWEIDPTTERLPRCQADHPLTWIYTYRKSHVSRYKAAGFQHVDYLPLGTNPKRRYPIELDEEERGRYGAEVAFVGNSMVDQAYYLKQLCMKLIETFSKDGKHKIANSSTDDNRISSLTDDWIAQDEQGRWVDLAMCMAETEASQRRIRIVSDLASLGYDVKVWGDEGWRGSLSDGAKYCGAAGHSTELTKIYNASAINLDINRIYQNDIVTMRVFDVLACRGFVLADHSEDLEELLDLGREVAAYRSSRELERLVEYFLSHEREREEIALAGYRKVVQDHTIYGRVQQMLRNLS